MKPKFIFYRLITFILLPIAGINALSMLGIIPAALGSPIMLIGVFINFAVIAYTFTSFSFFIRGIQNGKAMKPSLKDWIKVNAYVTILYAGLILLTAVIYFSSPTVQKMVSDKASDLQTYMKSSGNIDKATLLSQLKGALAFAAGYSAVLLAHIIITLGLLKKYASLFGNVTRVNNDDELR